MARDRESYNGTLLVWAISVMALAFGSIAAVYSVVSAGAGQLGS